MSFWQRLMHGPAPTPLEPTGPWWRSLFWWQRWMRLRAFKRYWSNIPPQKPLNTKAANELLAKIHSGDTFEEVRKHSELIDLFQANQNIEPGPQGRFVDLDALTPRDERVREHIHKKSRIVEEFYDD